MKITVNRAQFLEIVPAILAESSVSLRVGNGILAISSFTAGIVFKIVGYTIEPGVAFLSAEQWHELVYAVYQSERLVVDITEPSN